MADVSHYVASVAEGCCPEDGHRLDACDRHGRCPDCGFCWQLTANRQAVSYVVHLQDGRRGPFRFTNGTLHLPAEEPT